MKWFITNCLPTCRYLSPANKLFSMRFPIPSVLIIVPTLVLIAAACTTYPKAPFSAGEVPTAPNYSQDRSWAALPWREDAADRTPDGLNDGQADAKVDVFFLHPTTYTGKKRNQDDWNGPVKDDDLNESTSETSIQFQASLFNGTCRVFAPYYRQAHLHAYYSEDTLSARRAFDVAYNDVRKAFSYYLANHNRGRPIVIAAHSQGTTHATRLLREFFDGKPLAERLVAAYVIGIKVREDAFKQLTPCRDSTDLGCYVAWRTFERGVEPAAEEGVVVVNPLLWTTEETYAPAELNRGAVLKPFRKVRPGASDAQVHGPILWASKPKFFGNFVLTTENYHAGDFNIYYLNVRENVALRAEKFLQQNP